MREGILPHKCGDPGRGRGVGKKSRVCDLRTPLPQWQGEAAKPAGVEGGGWDWVREDDPGDRYGGRGVVSEHASQGRASTQSPESGREGLQASPSPPLIFFSGLRV